MGDETWFGVSSQRLEADGAVVQLVAVSGDVDLVVADEFGAALDEAASAAGVDAVVVDLGEVPFMDSSGLHALLRAADALRKAGTPVAVVAAYGSSPERLLALSGVDDRFARATNVGDAIAAVAQSGE